MGVSFESATALARMLRDRRISSVELLQETLAAYERYNDLVNAVVVTQIEQAFDQARQADQELSDGRIRGPLHGIPMTVKESFDWVGTPTTVGDPAFTGNFPETTAVPVQRLQAAGAIVYGKTNVPMHLADAQSFNDVYGTTNNPWALDRVAGGSSGGSAAALASGMTSLELGSDIAGSLRNPAHYCGVFGHKPTYRMVRSDGHGLPGTHADLDIQVVGPMARTAADLDLAMGILAGDAYRRTSGGRTLANFRVAVVLESPFLRQDPELTEQLRTGIDVLTDAGLTVKLDARPDLDAERTVDVHMLLLRAATGAAKPVAPRAADITADLERFRAGARDRPAFEARGHDLSYREWWELHNERERERAVWAAFFRRYDLLLCPTSASAAPAHDHRPDRFAPSPSAQHGVRHEPLYWALWPGVAYLPSTVVPFGLTRSGLPCGLQIVAPHGADALGIQFAGLVEQTLGGFQPAPLMSSGRP